jgi:hypothetical protein
MWLYVAICGHMWPYVAICVHMWTSGYKWPCGHMWAFLVIFVHLAISGHVAMWPYVAICGHILRSVQKNLFKGNNAIVSLERLANFGRYYGREAETREG